MTKTQLHLAASDAYDRCTGPLMAVAAVGWVGIPLSQLVWPPLILGVLAVQFVGLVIVVPWCV